MTAITRLLKASAVLVAVITFGNIVSAQNLLVYDSSPDSYELQGKSGIVTPADGIFGAFPSFGSANAVTATINGNTLWTMIFAAPNGARLAVGNYPNAADVPNATRPWISFGAFNRRCSQSGAFNVLQIDYAPDNTITALAIDFVVYDFGLDYEWSRGSFRFNSPIPVPEPTSFLLFSVAALVILSFQGLVRKHGTKGI